MRLAIGWTCQQRPGHPAGKTILSIPAWRLVSFRHHVEPARQEGLPPAAAIDPG